MPVLKQSSQLALLSAGRWEAQVDSQGGCPRIPFLIFFRGSTTGDGPATSQGSPGIKLWVGEGVPAPEVDTQTHARSLKRPLGAATYIHAGPPRRSGKVLQAGKLGTWKLGLRGFPDRPALSPGTSLGSLCGLTWTFLRAQLLQVKVGAQSTASSE